MAGEKYMIWCSFDYLSKEEQEEKINEYLADDDKMAALPEYFYDISYEPVDVKGKDGETLYRQVKSIDRELLRERIAEEQDDLFSEKMQELDRQLDCNCVHVDIKERLPKEHVQGYVECSYGRIVYVKNLNAFLDEINEWEKAALYVQDGELVAEVDSSGIYEDKYSWLSRKLKANVGQGFVDDVNERFLVSVDDVMDNTESLAPLIAEIYGINSQEESAFKSKTSE